ncbi:MAG: hypothetical protein ABIA78_02645 [archaeon]
MDENIEKNIELIEKEKKEFLDGTLEEDSDEEEEDVDVDVIEINLDEEEINEWIEKLERLREWKGHAHFDLDDENQLMINYEEGENNDTE